MFSTRGQAVREVDHEVRVSVEHGVATYRVRRTFFNRGDQADEVRLRIVVPHGAVATGLRIKAKDRWYDGELLPAAKAEELYRELTGMGPSEPKDPALLYWRWTDELGLRIFPVFAGKKSTVEYTLTAPTRYAKGNYIVSYPRVASNERFASPTIQFHGANIATVHLDGNEIGGREVALKPLPRHPLLVEHGLEGERVLVRTIRVPPFGRKTRTKLAKVELEATHTWRGDVRARLIDPQGKIHIVREADLSDSEHNLKESVELKLDTDPAGMWHLLVDDFHPLDGGRLRSWSLSFDDRTKFAERPNATIPQPTDSRSEVADLHVRLNDTSTHVRLGRVDLIERKHFYRFEADIAPRLSELPKRPSVVFVLDVSHTMDEAGIDAQLRLAEAYLSHVRDASFALVAYGRRANLLSKGFVQASTLPSLREALKKSGALAPRNGSFLDRGVERAIELLSKRQGNKALVLLTDSRLRSAWRTGKVLGFIDQLRADTPVHVVDVAHHNSDLQVERDDAHSLFVLAQRRGGIAVHAHGVLNARDVPLQKEALYLVRPDRIDNWRVDGLPGDARQSMSIDAGEAIWEGHELRHMAQVEQAPLSATLRGELWTTPVSYTASQSEPFHRATAGFVFGEDRFHKLSASEQFVIAMYARAVSPVTSYLAIEPGVRPSTIGLEGGTGFGTIGSGSGSGYGAGFGGMRTGLNWDAIAGELRDACANEGAGYTRLGLELQDREIADIEQQADGSAFARCVYEAAWSYTLPERSGDTVRWLSIRSR